MRRNSAYSQSRAAPIPRVELFCSELVFRVPKETSLRIVCSTLRASISRTMFLIVGLPGGWGRVRLVWDCAVIGIRRSSENASETFGCVFKGFIVSQQLKLSGTIRRLTIDWGKRARGVFSDTADWFHSRRQRGRCGSFRKCRSHLYGRGDLALHAHKLGPKANH